MEDLLPINKIYVDSRHASSGNSSSFTFELSESITLPRNTVCHVDSVQIPYSWLSVTTLNNAFHIRETYGASSNDITYYVEEGNFSGFTLATALSNILNIGSSLAGTYSAVFLAGLNKIAIAHSNSAGTFKILTDAEVGTENSINKILGNNSVNSTIGGHTITAGSDTTVHPAGSAYFLSSFIDTLRIHSIYLHSSSLGNYKSMGPRGERSCIRKVCVNCDWGEVIIDNLFHAQDFIECGGLNLKTLQFDIKDAEGQPVDLQSAHVSFSLLFSLIYK
jgi:hypothetical protein